LIILIDPFYCRSVQSKSVQQLYDDDDNTFNIVFVLDVVIVFDSLQGGPNQTAPLYISAYNRLMYLQNFMIFGTYRLHKASNETMLIWATLYSCRAVIRYFTAGV